MIVSMRSISISHVWFTFILCADQVEVAITQSLQGIDIQQSDVTILQGHTSEVWFIKKFSIDLWLCFCTIWYGEPTQDCEQGVSPLN